MKANAIVRLKSGGPDMKIKYVEGNNLYVEWTNDAGEVVEGTFKHTSVELVHT